MKKVLILLTVTLCSTSFYAQDLDLGIKAGMNFSNITDATGLSNRTGFVFGAFAGAKLGDKIGIQGDLLYSQQGAEFDGGEIDLNYVNVPVVLKYFLTESIHIHGGPQFGFVVDDNVKSVFQDIEEDDVFRKDYAANTQAIKIDLDKYNLLAGFHYLSIFPLHPDMQEQAILAKRIILRPSLYRAFQDLIK